MAGQFTFDLSDLGKLLLQAILPLGKLAGAIALGRISIEPDAIVFVLGRLGAQMVQITNIASAQKLLLHWSKHSEQFAEYLQGRAAHRESHTINAKDLRTRSPW